MNSKGFKCGIVRELEKTDGFSLFTFHVTSLPSTQTLECILVVLVEGLTRSLVAMTTTTKMPRLTQTGGLSVRYRYKLGSRDLCQQVPILMSIFTIIVDVKIDWCASKANGSTLDPKVQYAEFVSKFNFKNVFVITSDIILLFLVKGLQCYWKASLLQLV